MNLLEEFELKRRVPKECDNGHPLESTRGKYYFRIWDFMVFDFHLEKTELNVYAIIFGVHFNNAWYFYGSKEYLMKWTNASKRTVETALKSLVNKKLIVVKQRKIRGVIKNVYLINPDTLPICDLFTAENSNALIWAKYNEKRKKKGLPPIDPLKKGFYDNSYVPDDDEDYYL